MAIFPRKDSNGKFSLDDLTDFRIECARTRDLVNRVPRIHQRQLDSVTRRLSLKDRQDFYDLGNGFLVCLLEIYPFFNTVLGASAQFQSNNWCSNSTCAGYFTMDPCQPIDRPNVRQQRRIICKRRSIRQLSSLLGKNQS